MTKLTKNVLFKEEQYKILLKIFNIIGVTKDNTIIERNVIESDENIKIINDLVNDINKYFSFGHKISTKIGVHKEINIVKNVVKNFGISVFSIDKKRKDENNKYKSYTLYKFEIPNEILEKM